MVSLVQASLVLLTAFGGKLSAGQFGAVDSFFVVSLVQASLVLLTAFGG